MEEINQDTQIRILAALSDSCSLLADANGTVVEAFPDAIFIPYKTPPKNRKPTAPKKLKIDNLIMEAPVEIVREGVCRVFKADTEEEIVIGEYKYIDSPYMAVKLLDYWAEREAWAAIDLETSVAWREKLDDSTGQKIKVYIEVPDPFTSIIYLASISTEPGKAVVFDMRTLMKSERFNKAFRNFLVKAKLIAQGSLFEQSFFISKFDTVANIVFDTLQAHQLATAGKSDGSGLDDLMEKYYGYAIDKSWQKYFLKIHPTSPIAADAIPYSAGDVVLLLDTARKIETELIQVGMWNIWSEIEQPLMKWVAIARCQGITIDIEMVRGLQEEAETEVAEALANFKSIAGEDVLVSSPVQLIKWFNEKLGAIPGAKNISGTGEDILKKLAESNKGVVSQAASAVLDYRKITKAKSTYIDTYLWDHLCPITGRIHPFWKQNSTDTGRYACTDPNVQNIPNKGAASKIRDAVIAPPGYKVVTADFSQFEVRALADMAQEPLMISVFKEGFEVHNTLKNYCRDHSLPMITTDMYSKAKENEEKWGKYLAVYGEHPKVEELVKRLAECDFHSRTAATLFKIPVSQVSKEQRRQAKTVTFALPYGAGAPGIAQQANITIEEARELLEEYYSTYRAVKMFLDRCRIQAREKRFTCTPAGRKRFYELPTEKEILTQITTDKENPKAWAKLVSTWGNVPLSEMARKIYSFRSGKIEREGTNHPIQGVNADATKKATLLAAPRLKKLHENCTIIMWVHDEIVLITPEQVAEEAAVILESSMIEAAYLYIKNVPIEVTVKVDNRWNK